MFTGKILYENECHKYSEIAMNNCSTSSIQDNGNASVRSYFRNESVCHN